MEREIVFSVNCVIYRLLSEPLLHGMIAVMKYDSMNLRLLL